MQSPATAWIGLGSNLGQRREQLDTAVAALIDATGISAVTCSPRYETEPLGPADQPDYANAVCRITTSLSPDELLDELQAIEQQHGRVRDGCRWGPRTLDLDLLLYGDAIIDTPRLTVPHPRLTERAFVLRPLCDLDPHLTVPGRGPDTVTEWLQRCPEAGIRAF